MKGRLNSRYFLTVLLALLALGFALVIGREVGWGGRFSVPVSLPKSQPTKIALTALQPEFTLPPLETTYTEILARPLLVVTRKPPQPQPPPPVVVAPPPTMRKGQFLLLGVILTKEKNIALLREVATGKVSRVEQGKEINGVTVDKLEAEKVTFKQWGDTEEVVLKIQAMPKPQLPPVPTAVPGQPPQPGAASEAGPAPPQGVIARRRGLAP